MFISFMRHRLKDTVRIHVLVERYVFQIRCVFLWGEISVGQFQGWIVAKCAGAPVLQFPFRKLALE